MDSFLSTETVVPEKIDIDSLNKVYKDWHDSFIDQFKGVPVRIDEILKGGQYYIAVSRELYERLNPTERP
jgi:hypothetical protein